jgi:hypothetical protein
MKKLPLSLLILLFALVTNGQKLTPTVIASTGAYTSNTNGSLSYTLGEMTMVKTFSADNNILTQGFQQPSDLALGLLEILPDEFGSFAVYPNPAVDAASFAFRFPEQGKISVVLYNSLGQKLSNVFSTGYTSGSTVQTLNTTLLASGMYFLTLNFTGQGAGKEVTLSRKLQVIR